MRAFGVDPPGEAFVVETHCGGMSLLELGNKSGGDVCHSPNPDQRAQGLVSYCLTRESTLVAKRRNTMITSAALGAAGGLILGIIFARLF